MFDITAGCSRCDHYSLHETSRQHTRTRSSLERSRLQSHAMAHTDSRRARSQTTLKGNVIDTVTMGRVSPPANSIPQMLCAHKLFVYHRCYTILKNNNIVKSAATSLHSSTILTPTHPHALTNFIKRLKSSIRTNSLIKIHLHKKYDLLRDVIQIPARTDSISTRRLNENSGSFSNSSSHVLPRTRIITFAQECQQLLKNSIAPMLQKGNNSI